MYTSPRSGHINVNLAGGFYFEIEISETWHWIFLGDTKFLK